MVPLSVGIAGSSRVVQVPVSLVRGEFTVSTKTARRFWIPETVRWGLSETALAWRMLVGARYCALREPGFARVGFNAVGTFIEKALSIDVRVCKA